MVSNPKQRSLMYRGKAYRFTLRNGKIIVRLQRTAQGQTVIAGTYNLVSKEWENENSKAHIPTYVKKVVEKYLDS